MGIFNKDDIIAYRLGTGSDEEIVCKHCIEEDEYAELAQDEIITRDEFERGDDLVFCDRKSSDKCPGKIWP